MKGEKLYDCDLNVTGMTDYGLAMESIVSGKSPIPPQGVRVDIAFEGQAKGRLSGKVKGVDYLRIRADGRMDLDVHAVVETDDGQRIAFAAGGVLTPRSGEPLADVSENITLTTASEKYAWVNARQIWGVGTVNFADGSGHFEGYLQ